MDFLKKNWELVVMLVISIAVAYTAVYFLGKDNPIEQEVEQVIEAETGVKIDLTP
jgi:hypothetical protein